MPKDPSRIEKALEPSGPDHIERALRDGRSLFAAVLEHLPLGVGIYDRDGDLTHSNQRLRDFGDLSRLPSCQPHQARRWRAFDAAGRLIAPSDYPGARALCGEPVMPGTDFLYDPGDAPERWIRISAVPFRRDGADCDEAIVVVQDIDDLKRSGEQIESALERLASQSRFLEATLSSIPDYIHAFDAEHRFVYANSAMLELLGISAEEMLGKTFVELGYPRDLTEHLSNDIDRIFEEGVTVEDEILLRSPTGHAAYISYLWGPVRAADGSVELAAGVSRDTSERRAFEEAISDSEAQLRAATELVGLGIYVWNPVTDALDWDERVRAMWGLSPDAPVDVEVFEAGIHRNDLPRVREAIAACVDPAGDGRYAIEYRVIGRKDGLTRHISTSGRTSFERGRAVAFIGAAIDVTEQRRVEAAVRASEAQFRSFAEHSSNLLWIADPGSGALIYRSAVYERIWGQSCEEGAVTLETWMEDVHPDERAGVTRALEAVKAGDSVQYEYRVIRPKDGGLRWLRDTSFPIRDEHGAITRIGGIAEDLTHEDGLQVYIVSAKAAEARRLANLIRLIDYRARVFESAAAFLDIAPVLAPGCVLVDLRRARDDGLTIPRELKARSITLPTITLDDPGSDIAFAVAAMKAGAIDYIVDGDEDDLRGKLGAALAECHAGVRPTTRDEGASAHVARLTPREREVLVGLIDGGTNKTIALALGISPRTIELHRAQVMSKLGAGSLTELVQIALAAGVAPSATNGKMRKPT